MRMKILRASPYFWEKAKRIDLAEHHREGKLSFMLLNQPPICNARCKRCFMEKEGRALAESLAEGDTEKGDGTRPRVFGTMMGLEEWRSVIEKGKERGLLSIEFSGEGEPLLSKDTIPIIRYANSLGIIATLITNGHALSEGIIRTLLEEEATLVFSLHSLDPKKYENDNRCPGSYLTIMRAIEKAAGAFAGSSYVDNGYRIQRIAIHTTLQSDNIDEIDDLRRFCHERSIFFSIAPLANTGNAVLHPELHTDREIAEVTTLGDNSIIHSKTSAGLYGREVCGTAAYGMSIGFDGNLLPDAHGGYNAGSVLGNIRTHSFNELYDNWRIMVSRMFKETRGFCPVRDAERFEGFVRKILQNANQGTGNRTL